MNIQQLEYIIAVDNLRHFARAAEACFVTQPTLSMMIQKLEEELGVKIFDRSRQPVAPTLIGAKVIVRARVALIAVQHIREVIDEEKGLLQGHLRLGILPTIAPYLMPAFIRVFTEAYPALNLQIYEMVTEQVIAGLHENRIEGAILATPLGEKSLTEYPLYHENFYGYISETEEGYKKDRLTAADIAPGRLWLLEEGHCFRSQILHFCDIRKRGGATGTEGFVYEAGSIETLIRMVDRRGGMTIIPELALPFLTEEQKLKIRPFAEPVPVREVSLVTRKDYLRTRIIEAFVTTVRRVIPEEMMQSKLEKHVLGI